MKSKELVISLYNYNSSDNLLSCLNSILQNDSNDFQLEIIDDGSIDESMSIINDWVKQHPLLNCTITHHSFQGIASSVNEIIRKNQDKAIVRMTSEIIIRTYNWITKVLDLSDGLQHQAIISGRMLFPDNRILSDGLMIIKGINYSDRYRCKNYLLENREKENPVIEVDAVSDDFLFLPSSVISDCGFFDENYFPHFTDAEDYCIMARYSGHKVFVDTSLIITKRVYIQESLAELVPQFKSLESLLQSKQLIQEQHTTYWKEKWGWDYLYPDLNYIRQNYYQTEICWRIGEPMNFRFDWDKGMPSVDILVVTFNNVSLLKKTLESIELTDYSNELLTIILVNNGSTDTTDDYIKKEYKTRFRFTYIIMPTNVGLPAGMNIALKNSSSHFAARLDDDIVLESDWLLKMLEIFKYRPFTGVVGAKILNDNKTRSIQFAYSMEFPHFMNFDDRNDIGQVDLFVKCSHVKGCCNLYRRDGFKDFGNFDIAYSPSQFDDPDHQLSVIDSGYDIIYTGFTKVIHKLNDGAKKSISALSNQRGNGSKMLIKWGEDIFKIVDRGIHNSAEGRYLNMHKFKFKPTRILPSNIDYRKNLDFEGMQKIFHLYSLHRILLKEVDEYFLGILSKLKPHNLLQDMQRILNMIMTISLYEMRYYIYYAYVLGSLGKEEISAEIMEKFSLYFPNESVTQSEIKSEFAKALGNFKGTPLSSLNK